MGFRFSGNIQKFINALQNMEMIVSKSLSNGSKDDAGHMDYCGQALQLLTPESMKSVTHI